MYSLNWILSIIFLPLVGGLLLAVLRFQKRLHRELFVEGVVIATSILTYVLLLRPPVGTLVLLQITDTIQFGLKMDGLARVFAGLIAGLWPFATLFAFQYMTHEGKENTFFVYYTMTFGITLGVACSSNAFTLYLFYELLTLITLPLVMHSMNEASKKAGMTYIKYSIGGAAFGFVALVFLLQNGANEFVYGGSLSLSTLGVSKDMMLWAYVFAFFGFGVKAAIFPFQGWLPKASVAPTPVTALLHAVAVVKSGVFAVTRMTYYCFGAEFLRGTWAQSIVMIAALVTILYGSVQGVREQHIKRRLAYSTISNLSYILFAVTLMSPAGLLGGILHMVFHGVIKITLFFCAGAIMFQTHKEYVNEITGFGKKMPLIFGIFTIASLSIMGVPPFNGFVSKWYILTAAMKSATPLAIIGVLFLLLSGLLAAIYLFRIIVAAFFPIGGFDYDALKKVKDPNWYMLVPLFVFTIAVIGFGIKSGPLIEFVEKIVYGVI